MTDKDEQQHLGEMGEEEVIVEEIDEPEEKKESIATRLARNMARRAWLHIGVSFVVILLLSVLGFIFGNFSVEADNRGWQSRGTFIANRQAQALLTLLERTNLFLGGDEVWDNLLNNVQEGWQEDDGEARRRLMAANKNKRLPFHLTPQLERRLQDAIILNGCSYDFLTELEFAPKLWPVWETREPSISALDASVIRDICVAEQNTLSVLVANGLCNTCGGEKRCAPPASLVLFVRLVLNDTTMSMTCDELAEAWSSSDLMDPTVADLQTCVGEVKLQGNFDVPPASCNAFFGPFMVDEAFGTGNTLVRYTSSIFDTNEDLDGLYEHAGEYDRAPDSTVVYGAYDTQDEDLVNMFAGQAVTQDMVLAMGSAVITTAAILVHTRSLWLTVVGLFQIILSFPLSYFVYTIVAQLDFFPFLNFIGVFVVFALGADVVFVAVDKWKNARLENPTLSREDIAAIALPDAAGAMFLTTLTTAVAFFATAICPVAPLKMFAIFNGLLISFDYIMCLLLVFPALCIYDKWKYGLDNGCCLPCCVHCSCCDGRKANAEDGEEPYNKGVVVVEDGEVVEEKVVEEKGERPSFIRRVLLGYYDFLHFSRWPLLAVCVGALVASAVFAATLKLPNSSDVRLVRGTIQYERNFEWRKFLLSSVLSKSSGSDAVVIWGVEPADTGDINNPATFTQLVLDDAFDPSTTAGQEYLLGFCEDFFANDFAGLVYQGYECPINQFDSWLRLQSGLATPTQAYTSNCGGATGIPMPQADFNRCIVAWSYEVGGYELDYSVLSRNDVLEIMFVRFQSTVRFDSPYSELDREWHRIEDYLEAQRKIAPAGVNMFYHSSDDFWWYDTNGRMLQTAIGAAAIALGAAGLVVLFSSRSVVLTIFALFTIGYVLCSTTAMLVATGWTLGFLESVCFAILIGISCDFVIHFGHAYAHLPGNVDRHQRTKHALITMGPSILAAAFTTICAAAIMLFTVIVFFQKFAVILFYTIIQATIGSFVVYLVLSDTIGPTHPTYLMDLLFSKCKRNKDATKEVPE